MAFLPSLEIGIFFWLGQKPDEIAKKIDLALIFSPRGIFADFGYVIEHEVLLPMIPNLVC